MKTGSSLSRGVSSGPACMTIANLGAVHFRLRTVVYVSQSALGRRGCNKLCPAFVVVIRRR